MEAIKFDDFAKAELKIGTVVDARLHPNADRLLILDVSLGEDKPRQIVAGIRQRYTPDAIRGKQVVVVTNLEPVVLRGERSEGMLLAAADTEGPVVLTPEKLVNAGSNVK